MRLSGLTPIDAELAPTKPVSPPARSCCIPLTMAELNCKPLAELAPPIPLLLPPPFIPEVMPLLPLVAGRAPPVLPSVWLPNTPVVVLFVDWARQTPGSAAARAAPAMRSRVKVIGRSPVVKAILDYRGSQVNSGVVNVTNASCGMFCATESSGTACQILKHCQARRVSGE